MLWVTKNNEDKFTFLFSSNKPKSGAQVVPSNLWNENTDYLVVSEQEIEQPDGSIKIKYNVSLDQGTKDAAEAAKAAQSAAREAFANLNKEVETDAAQVAGTTNQISAIMDLFTYQRMLARPELFDQEGIVAKKAIGTFNQGDALDNELKIKQYAEAMLAESDAFMIRRLKKITDYILS